MGIWEIKTLKLVLIIADAIFMVIMSSLSLALIFVFCHCDYCHIRYVCVYAYNICIINKYTYIHTYICEQG